jgi:hypothetical protein
VNKEMSNNNLTNNEERITGNKPNLPDEASETQYDVNKEISNNNFTNNEGRITGNKPNLPDEASENFKKVNIKMYVDNKEIDTETLNWTGSFDYAKIVIDYSYASNDNFKYTMYLNGEKISSTFYSYELIFEIGNNYIVAEVEDNFGNKFTKKLNIIYNAKNYMEKIYPEINVGYESVEGDEILIESNFNNVDIRAHWQNIPISHRKIEYTTYIDGKKIVYNEMLNNKKLTEGMNEIEIKIIDNFGNEKLKILNINYKKK